MSEPANINPRTGDRKQSAPFLGSWSLVSFEHVLPSGVTGSARTAHPPMAEERMLICSRGPP